MQIEPIAYIRSDFPEKFGIPRQSGLAASLKAEIVFEEKYRNEDALRGLDDFSHIWVIWEFSANRSTADWQPTVRPPRLGGNRTMGVFATRSPFRPNPLGLSCLELCGIDYERPDGPVILVTGADLMDGTPIYDIKPYIKYADSRPHARSGYVESLKERKLKVVLPEEEAVKMPDKERIPGLIEILSLDPRPSYHDDPERIYGLSYAECNIRFRVEDGFLYVQEISYLSPAK